MPPPRNDTRITHPPHRQPLAPTHATQTTTTPAPAAKSQKLAALITTFESLDLKGKSFSQPGMQPVPLHLPARRREQTARAAAPARARLDADVEMEMHLRSLDRWELERFAAELDVEERMGRGRGGRAVENGVVSQSGLVGGKASYRVDGRAAAQGQRVSDENARSGDRGFRSGKAEHFIGLSASDDPFVSHPSNFLTSPTYRNRPSEQGGVRRESKILDRIRMFDGSMDPTRTSATTKGPLSVLSSAESKKRVISAGRKPGLYTPSSVRNGYVQSSPRSATRTPTRSAGMRSRMWTPASKDTRSRKKEWYNQHPPSLSPSRARTRQYAQSSTVTASTPLKPHRQEGAPASAREVRHVRHPSIQTWSDKAHPQSPLASQRYSREVYLTTPTPLGDARVGGKMAKTRMEINEMLGKAIEARVSSIKDLDQATLTALKDNGVTDDRIGGYTSPLRKKPDPGPPASLTQIFSPKNEVGSLDGSFQDLEIDVPRDATRETPTITPPPVECCEFGSSPSRRVSKNLDAPAQTGAAEAPPPQTPGRDTSRQGNKGTLAGKIALFEQLFSNSAEKRISTMPVVMPTRELPGKTVRSGTCGALINGWQRSVGEGVCEKPRHLESDSTSLHPWLQSKDISSASKTSLPKASGVEASVAKSSIPKPSPAKPSPTRPSPIKSPAKKPSSPTANSRAKTDAAIPVLATENASGKHDTTHNTKIPSTQPASHNTPPSNINPRGFLEIFSPRNIRTADLSQGTQCTFHPQDLTKSPKTMAAQILTEQQLADQATANCAMAGRVKTRFFSLLDHIDHPTWNGVESDHSAAHMLVLARWKQLNKSRMAEMWGSGMGKVAKLIQRFEVGGSASRRETWLAPRHHADGVLYQARDLLASSNVLERRLQIYALLCALRPHLDASRTDIDLVQAVFMLKTCDAWFVLDFRHKNADDGEEHAPIRPGQAYHFEGGAGPVSWGPAEKMEVGVSRTIERVSGIRADQPQQVERLILVLANSSSAPATPYGSVLEVCHKLGIQYAQVCGAEQVEAMKMVPGLCEVCERRWAWMQGLLQLVRSAWVKRGGPDEGLGAEMACFEYCLVSFAFIHKPWSEAQSDVMTSIMDWLDFDLPDFLRTRNFSQSPLSPERQESVPPTQRQAWKIRKIISALRSEFRSRPETSTSLDRAAPDKKSPFRDSVDYFSLADVMDLGHSNRGPGVHGGEPNAWEKTLWGYATDFERHWNNCYVIEDQDMVNYRSAALSFDEPQQNEARNVHSISLNRDDGAEHGERGHGDDALLGDWKESEERMLGGDALDGQDDGRGHGKREHEGDTLGRVNDAASYRDEDAGVVFGEHEGSEGYDYGSEDGGEVSVDCAGSEDHDCESDDLHGDNAEDGYVNSADEQDEGPCAGSVEEEYFADSESERCAASEEGEEEEDEPGESDNLSHFSEPSHSSDEEAAEAEDEHEGAAESEYYEEVSEEDNEHESPGEREHDEPSGEAAVNTRREQQFQEILARHAEKTASTAAELAASKRRSEHLVAELSRHHQLGEAHRLSYDDVDKALRGMSAAARREYEDGRPEAFRTILALIQEDRERAARDGGGDEGETPLLQGRRVASDDVKAPQPRSATEQERMERLCKRM